MLITKVENKFGLQDRAPYTIQNTKPKNNNFQSLSSQLIDTSLGSDKPLPRLLF